MMKKYCDCCGKEFEEGTKELIHKMEVTERYEVDEVPAEILKEKGEVPNQPVKGKVQMQSRYELDVCNECFQEKFAEFSHNPAIEKK